MAQEFQGGVCGTTWWNNLNLFNGGDGGGFMSPCSVAQFSDGDGGGGGYDMGSFGWPYELMKAKFNNNNQVCDDDINNNLDFSADFDSSTLDILSFGFSPTTSTTNWSQQNQFCKDGNNEENYASILQDNMSSSLTTSSNNSLGDNSSLTSFPVSSSAAYLIQTLFDDIDNESPLSVLPKLVPEITDPNNYGSINDMFGNGGQQFSNCDYNNMTTLSNIQASLSNQESNHGANVTTKLKQEDDRREMNKNMNNDQPIAKRQRIETLSPLPSFKVRKEKLGDRITALQQLVSPFGKTDTASVLHEAIEYIKFLHDQVNVLSTPHLKNGAPGQHQQVMNDNGDVNSDLRSRGLCLVSISSTYPVTQETPVDFWTPTF
ncbi:transcription factor bHLH112-like isoform X2 [Silene latifolia]|uniref:transcription factor bHLH112-like isoform X2 n=1 Tax=Silene latifolia TaxID=37657 RepID=UPI003D779F6A